MKGWICLTLTKKKENHKKMQEKITVNSMGTLYKKEELKKEISQMKKAAEKLFQCESMDYKKGVELSKLIYGEIERLESLLNK